MSCPARQNEAFRILRGVLLVLLLLADVSAGRGLQLWAQSPVPEAVRRPESPAQADAGTTAQPRSVQTPVTDGEMLIRTGNGELVPLESLLGADSRAILDDIVNRALLQKRVPSWRFSRLELEGDISRDVLTLSAELTISVERDQEWVSVPVAFSDLHLEEISHETDCEHGRAMPDTSNPALKRWWLYGEGTHTIRLRLIGKTRPQATAGHTMTLDLPQATISHATLRFAAPVELKLPPDSVQQTTVSDAGVTAVEFWGLTPGFSLSWVEVVPQVSRKPVIQVQSNRMKLDLNSIPVTLSGSLAVQISGSSVNELTVLFPAGFTLLEVTALNQADDSVLSGFEVTSVPTGSSAVIRLSTPVEGLLKLNVEMELENRTFPQDIQFRIPVVRDANIQSGDLDIAIPPGLRVQQTRIEGAQRKRVTSETDNNVQATAFRLRSADSLVVLHVEEIQAQYAIYPEMVFEPDGENVLMSVRFPVNVVTGSLLDLNIRWPGYSTGIWQILPGTTLLVSDKQSLPLSLEQDSMQLDRFKLTFPERQSGDFRVDFQAYAPISSLRGASSSLICPTVESREGEPIIVTTIESDSYSLQPVNTETARTLQTAPFQSTAIAEAASRNRNAQAWLHNQPEASLSLELIRQAPSVTTAMVVGLVPRDAGIEVHQDITFQIEHSELSTLSFIVPEGVQPAVSVAGDPERLRASLDSATSWSFRLPSPRRGTVHVNVDYLWAVTADHGDNDVTLELPLVLPMLQTSDMKRCEVGATVASGLQVKDEQNWSPVFSDHFEAAWLIEGPASSVPIRWQRSVSLHAEEAPVFLMSRSQLILAEVLTSTLAVFENGQQSFSFVLPETVRPASISVNGRSLRDSGGKIYRSAAGGLVRWKVTPGEADSGGSSSGETDRATRTGGSSALNGAGSFIVEIQVREQVTADSALYQRSQFHRPDFTESPIAVPSIWIFESQDDFRTISDVRGQSVLAPQAWLTARSAGIGDVETRVSAILSPFPAGIQSRVREQLEDWTSMEHRQDVFFLMSDTGPLSLFLIPGVSLLLVSALICATFFSAMIILRLQSVAVPLLLIVAALPALYLAFPEWTVLLTPYVAVGAALGIVSLTIQRVGTVRLRFPGRSRSEEMLTIFGYTGFLSESSSVVRSGGLVTGAESSSLSSR